MNSYSTGAIPYSGCSYLSLPLERRRWQNSIALVRAMVMSVIIVLGVRIPALGGCTRLAIILFDMMVVVALAAWARARPRLRTRAQRRSGTRLTPSSGQIAGARGRGLVIMHGLVALFLEVITLVIILLVIRLVASHVLVIASRAIVALIILMTLVGLLIIAVASVALVVVAIFTTAMLTVAWFTATCNRKLSRFPFLWLLVLFLRTPATFSVAWHCSKKAIILSGSVGTICWQTCSGAP